MAIDVTAMRLRRGPGPAPDPAPRVPPSRLRALRARVRGALRVPVGLLAGAGTAVGALLGAVLAAVCLLPVLAWPRGRRRVVRAASAGALVLTRLERRRLAAFLGAGAHADPGGRRAPAYLAVRVPLGLLGALVTGSMLIGAAYGSALLWGWFLYGTRYLLAWTASAVGGVFLLFLCAHGAHGVAALERRAAARLLGPSPQEALERRIGELSATRAGAVDAVHDERRRIERDLHDGVQQRLVALGMLLGRARRTEDEARSRELLVQAHEESRRALEELREVAWRVYPAALDEAGLHAALETVAERSGLPVRLDYRLSGQPAPTVAAVAYFVVCEAVTNAAKHSGAGLVAVQLEERPPGPGRERPRIAVRVRDDGRGGADPGGGGLLGLARRAAAIDGTFHVDSPPGGPTVITAELPCA